MVIFGVDAGLTAPGFAVVETSDTNPVGKILFAECFTPKWKTDETGHKANIRKTDQDAWRIRQIIRRLLTLSFQYKPNVIIAELPTGGAKSGAAIRGMAFSTAMTVSFLESLDYFEHTWPTEVVTITPLENKKGGTGKLKWDIEIEQGKWEIMVAINNIWPSFKWPMKKKRPSEYDDGLCWAISDALSCIATYLRRKGTLPPLK